MNKSFKIIIFCLKISTILKADFDECEYVYEKYVKCRVLPGDVMEITPKNIDRVIVSDN